MDTVEGHDSGYRGGDVQEAYDAGYAEGRLAGTREAFAEMVQVAYRAYEEGLELGFDEGYEASTRDGKAAALKRWLAA